MVRVWCPRAALPLLHKCCCSFTAALLSPLLSLAPAAAAAAAAAGSVTAMPRLPRQQLAQQGKAAPSLPARHCMHCGLQGDGSSGRGRACALLQLHCCMPCRLAVTCAAMCRTTTPPREASVLGKRGCFWGPLHCVLVQYCAALVAAGPPAAPRPRRAAPWPPLAPWRWRQAAAAAPAQHAAYCLSRLGPKLLLAPFFTCFPLLGLCAAAP